MKEEMLGCYRDLKDFYNPSGLIWWNHMPCVSCWVFESKVPA